ncbi:hypothetical protein [Kribbella flavida]|nr:hypothetical protein [Kribbella flavida]
MVGRFIVRPGNGDNDWSVWDNAANGRRGSGLSRQQAVAEAAELELQYDAHGHRLPETVRRVDPPVAVERIWQPVGAVDAWVREGGRWIARIRQADGGFSWAPEGELRKIEKRN